MCFSELIDLPVACNHCNADTSGWARVQRISVPEGDDGGQGSDLEGDDEGLVDEEVPASQEA